MYEVWLVLNIVWELALSIWPVLLLVVSLWAGMLVFAGTRKSSWSDAVKPAGLSGMLMAVVAFMVVPGAIGSALSNVDYWVDWANLIAISVGFGFAFAVFLWPLLAGLKPRRRR